MLQSAPNGRPDRGRAGAAPDPPPLDLLPGALL